MSDLREWAQGSLRWAPDERSAPDPEDVLALLDWVDRVDAMARRWARDLNALLDPRGAGRMSEASARQRQQYRDILEEGDRMRAALAAFELWAAVAIVLLGHSEVADFGRDRIAQSQAARSVVEEGPR